MDTIIQQFGEKIKENTEEFLVNVAMDNGEDISDFIKLLREDMDKLGREVCKYLLESLDEMLLESSKRKEKWKVKKKDQERTLMTEFGAITFERRYYESKFNDEYQFLVDKKVGIGKYQRIDRGLEAELIDKSTDSSYDKVGTNTVDSLELSGQTVMNKIRKLEQIDNDKLNEADEKKEVKYLYVEADEDHVALQNGKNSMPKLVYVHEGIEKEEGRNKLKNVYCFSGVYRKTEDLWQEVMDYIDENYELDSIKNIYLGGDGASWIKKGLEWLPKSKQILDRYHLNKYVLKATGHAKKLRFELWEGINNLDREKLREVFSQLISKAEADTKKTAIRKSRNYIYRNWAGIVNYYEDDNSLGCSAEGHVSHILSDRLSSRPMGWSELGVDQMARLRAFKFNGGELEDLKQIILEKEKENQKEQKLVEIESKVVNKRLRKKYKGKNENIPSINKGKRTGLFKAVKSLI